MSIEQTAAAQFPQHVPVAQKVPGQPRPGVPEAPTALDRALGHTDRFVTTAERRALGHLLAELERYMSDRAPGEARVTERDARHLAWQLDQAFEGRYNPAREAFFAAVASGQAFAGREVSAGTLAMVYEALSPGSRDQLVDTLRGEATQLFQESFVEDLARRLGQWNLVESFQDLGDALGVWSSDYPDDPGQAAAHIRELLGAMGPMHTGAAVAEILRQNALAHVIRDVDQAQVDRLFGDARMLRALTDREVDELRDIIEAEGFRIPEALQQKVTSRTAGPWSVDVLETLRDAVSDEQRFPWE